MRRLISGVGLFAMAVLVLCGSAVTADAQRVNVREVRDIVRNLNAKIDEFDQTLRFRLRSISAPRRVGQEAAASVEGLNAAMRTFEQNLDQRRENRTDINAVIAAAYDVNGFMRANPQDRRIESTWNEVRDLIGRLSGLYGVTPDWSGRTSNASNIGWDNDRGLPTGGFTHSLTGTYQLDERRSENVADIVADTRVAGNRRQDLESKLDAPTMLSISVRGQQVALATSIADPVTFAADGREKTEMSGGRTVRVRATLTGDDLTVASLGGETDYTITFESIDNGRGLKVTRRITTEYLPETVFADSYYTKTDAVARLGIDDQFGDDDDLTYDGGTFSSNDPDDQYGANMPNPTLSRPRVGEFLIPNGVIVTGLLENEINTRASQNFDRFRMTVQSPIEYRGAVIEGYLSGVGRSGQVSGRSNVTFNFERITLRDGRAYDFAGFLTSVKDHTGKDVRVDTEGTAQGDSQTRETAKRGGIGAGIGAVIGAIAGGAKGAAIGAVIGGGAGAGSVIVGGRDDVRLLPGSTISVESSSPVRQN